MVCPFHYSVFQQIFETALISAYEKPSPQQVKSPLFGCCQNHSHQLLFIHQFCLSLGTEFMAEICKWHVILHQDCTKPTPEASVSITKALEKSGRASTGREIIESFRCRKACFASSFQWIASLLSCWVKGQGSSYADVVSNKPMVKPSEVKKSPQSLERLGQRLAQHCLYLDRISQDPFFTDYMTHRYNHEFQNLGWGQLRPGILATIE